MKNVLLSCVSDPPVRPTNLTVEFTPLDTIRLWLDPVKIGMDLNDNTTLWTVNFIWR